MDAAAAAEDYRSSLNDLVANSKPLINMLTMLADENQQFAEHIVEVIETHIQKVKPGEKLPALYLIDSIIKNARESPYVPLFRKNIAHVFCHVFEQVDEKTRQAMYKLRQTWNDIFPLRKLYTIDVLVSRIDPAWPVPHVPPQALTAPSTGIHVNPKFLSRPAADEQAASTIAASAAAASATAAAAASAVTEQQQQQLRNLPDSDDVKRQLMAKQDELLKLQQQKLELELAHAKAHLEKLEKLKQQPAALSAPAAQSVLRKTEELQDPRISSRPRDAASSLRDQQHSTLLASSLSHPPPLLPLPLSEDRGGESTSVRTPNHALANHGATAAAAAGPIADNQRAPGVQRRHTAATVATGTAYQAGWSAAAAAPSAAAASTLAVKADESMQGGAGRSRKQLADPRQESAAGDGRFRGQPAAEALSTARRPMPPPPVSPAPSGAAAKVLLGMQGMSKRISPIRDATFSMSRPDVNSKDKDERLSVRDVKRERAAESVATAAVAAAGSEKSKPAKSGDRVAKVSKGPVRSGDARPGDGKPPTVPQAVAEQLAEPLQLQDQADRASVAAAHRAGIPLKGRGSVQNASSGREGSEPGTKQGASASGSGVERNSKGPALQDKDERVPRVERQKAADAVGRSAAADVDMRVDAAKAKDGVRTEVKKEPHLRTETKDRKQPKAGDSSSRAPAAAASAIATATTVATSRAGPKGGRSQPEAPAGATSDRVPSTGGGRQRHAATAAASAGTAAVDKDERIKPGPKNSLDKDDRIAEPKRSPIMAMKIPKKQPPVRVYRRNGSPENGRRPGSPNVPRRSRSRSPRARALAPQPAASHGDLDMRPRRRTPPPATESPQQASDAHQTAVAVPPASASAREDVDLRKLQPATSQHKGKPPAPMDAAAVCDDVDLRVQTRKRQTQSSEDEEKDSPAMKKGRRSDEEDDYDDDAYNEAGDLFGAQDQDYRRYPAGLPLASPAAHSGWTAFKETHQRTFSHGAGHRSHGPDGDIDLRQQQQEPYRELASPRQPSMQPLQHLYGTTPPRPTEAMLQQDQLRSLRSKAEWRYHNGDISHEDYQDALARLEDLQRLRPPPQHPHGREWPDHCDRLSTPLGGGNGAPTHRFSGSDSGGPPPEQQQHRPPPPVGPFNQPPPGMRPGTGQHSPIGRGHSWDWQQQPPPDGGSGFSPQQQHQPQSSYQPPQPAGSGGFGSQQTGFPPAPPGSGRFTPPMQHGGGFVPPPQPPPQLPDFHGQYRGPATYGGSQASVEDDRRYAPPMSSPVPSQMQRPRFESQSEVVIDGKPYELTLGLKARLITIGIRKWMVRADKDTREILIDEMCYYRLGDPPRDVMLAGQTHRIYFHGYRRHIWVDGLQYDVRVDAPPQTIIIGGRRHTLHIESHTNKLIIDSIDRGICSSGHFDVDLGALHRVSFEPPPKQITIDNKLCELNFDGPLPVVVINGRMHGIRFDGPPREIIIDDVPYLVRMDQPVRIKLGRRPHSLAFGGPGYEVVIDGKHYEVIFNGPPREVNIGGSSHTVRLVGEPPGVKILGEVIQTETRPSALGGMPLPPPLPPSALRLPGQPPGAALYGVPQPMRLPGDLSGVLGLPPPPPLWLAPPAFLGLVPPPMPHHPVMAPMTTILPPPMSAVLPLPVAPAKVDVNELFSKLLQYGIISKKEPDGAAAQQAAAAADERLDDVIDLTDLSEEKLKGKHPGVLQRLYVGTQCATCGMRFLSSEAAKYNQHLDWHFRQNKRDKEAPKTTLCRKWYFPIDVWVTYEEFTDADESNIFLGAAPSGGTTSAAASVAASESVSCPIATGNEKDDVCEICGDPFEHFWGEEEEAWHLKDAIRVKGKTYHPICYEDACETSTIESTEPSSANTVKDESLKSQNDTARADRLVAAVPPTAPEAAAAASALRPSSVSSLAADTPQVPSPSGSPTPLPPAAVPPAAVDPGALGSSSCPPAPVVAAASAAAAAAAVDEHRDEAGQPAAPTGGAEVDEAAPASCGSSNVLAEASPPPAAAAGGGNESGASPAAPADSSPDVEYGEPGTPVQDERVVDGS